MPGLLLETEQLLDCRLRLAILCDSSVREMVADGIDAHTLASFSASGRRASTSLVKSLSALRMVPSDMAAEECVECGVAVFNADCLED